VLLESILLSPYADAIRKATSLPVFDAVTLIDFFNSAATPEPYYGVDWAALEK